MKSQFIYIIIFLTTLYSQCDSYTSFECDSNSNCEWVEDIELGNCYDLNSSSACYANECDGWNNGNNYYLLPYCYGGTYVIEDNSYCQEVAVLACLELDELQCYSDDSCNWVNDYQWGNCNDLGSSSCDANPNCWGAYTNPGWYYGWYCAGGNYQIDNSYCESISFEQGDVNGDSLINVLDVIQVINLILDSEYDFIVDMNHDDEINVLDIVIIVDIILGN